MKRTVWIACVLMCATGVCQSKANDKVGSNSITPIPSDCDKPELLVNGRPSMMRVGANLPFGPLSVTKQEVKALAIGLSVTKREFKAGDPIKLHVWVANSGDDSIGVMTCSDLGLFKTQGFDIFDAHDHRLLTRRDVKVAEECNTDLRRANYAHERLGICGRNFPITIPAHTCVTRDDYDFTTDLASEYDLPPGEYTLHLRTNWKITEDLCERQSDNPIHPVLGDITFSVTRP